MELSLPLLIALFLLASLAVTSLLGKLPQRFVPQYWTAVKKAREKKRISREALAHLCTITPADLARIEAGKQHPSNHTARLLEKHLGIVILRLNTFYVITLAKTTSTTLFDRFAHHTRVVNFMADAGLLLGFGSLAVDHRFGKNKPRVFRGALFIVSLALLYLFFTTLLLGVLENPFTQEYNPVLAASFAFGGFAGFLISSLFTYGVFIIQSILAGERVCPGIAPLIPGIELPNVPVVLPLHAWISFVIILLVHEGMHGILARKNKYAVKSAGLLLFGFLPIGAFVEPDDQEIKKGSEKEALRIFAAGPAGNLFTMLFFLLAVFGFVFLIFNPFIAPWQTGILNEGISHFTITAVEEKISFCGKEYISPAFVAGLPVGSKIVSLNGSEIVPNKPLPIERGQPVHLVVDVNGVEKTVFMQPTELGQLGFSLSAVWKDGYTIPPAYETYRFLTALLGSFFFWLIVLNFLVAIVNFLPIEPFDGGKMAKLLLAPYFGFLGMPRADTEQFVGRMLLWVVGIALLVNALPLFV